MDQKTINVVDYYKSLVKPVYTRTVEASSY